MSCMTSLANPPSMAIARQVNSQTIMDIIIHHGPVARVEIAKRAGVSKQTVSEVVRVLEDLYLLEPAEVSASAAA